MSATLMRRNTMPLDQWQPFADLIKSQRIAHGWPMRKFARLAGISLGYLGLIETSHCPPPSDEVLMRMAEHLDISPTTLFTLAGRLPPETLMEFWQHPAIPPILSTIPGMSLSDAQTFCQQMRATLPHPA